MSAQFSLFDTPIGFCALLWDRSKITGVQLPEGDCSETRSSILKRFPDAEECAPPLEMKRVIARLVGLLERGDGNFRDVELAWEGISAFQKSVYVEAMKIPPGETRSYGEIAQDLGRPGAARAVGMALGRNPLPLLVPCHRVVGAAGKLGGFTAHEGTELKRKLLLIERNAVASQGESSE